MKELKNMPNGEVIGFEKLRNNNTCEMENM